MAAPSRPTPAHDALKAAQGNVSAAARAFGLSRAAFRDRLGTEARALKAAAEVSVASPDPIQLTDVPRSIPEDPGTTSRDPLALDRERHRLLKLNAQLQSAYQEALHTIESRDATIRSWEALQDTTLLEPLTPIVPRHGHGTSEGTVVVVASDWHIEEQVGPEVGGLNHFDPTIADARTKQFFQAALRLTQILQQDCRIETMVLALLGDFISNDIHEELVELNSASPMVALQTAQAMLVRGIDFLLNHSALTLQIPCHSGNHARTTRTTRFAREYGHSLEYLMYGQLASHYRHEPRVRFTVPVSLHSYVDIYEMRVRFHHGHALRYQGGVGGIYIPVNKAIAQWNKARRADLDMFGHFHQFRDGGNFICNGSLIGYNAFALSIKADYERPQQALCLIDKRRGRTCTWPILFDQ